MAVVVAAAQVADRHIRTETIEQIMLGGWREVCRRVTT